MLYDDYDNISEIIRKKLKVTKHTILCSLGELENKTIIKIMGRTKHYNEVPFTLEMEKRIAEDNGQLIDFQGEYEKIKMECAKYTLLGNGYHLLLRLDRKLRLQKYMVFDGKKELLIDVDDTYFIDNVKLDF